MSIEEKPGYVIHDKRGEVPPAEVCRVCGAPVVHTREYNKPTMPCIEYLRAELARAQAKPEGGPGPAWSVR